MTHSVGYNVAETGRWRRNDLHLKWNKNDVR